MQKFAEISFVDVRATLTCTTVTHGEGNRTTRGQANSRSVGRSIVDWTKQLVGTGQSLTSPLHDRRLVSPRTDRYAKSISGTTRATKRQKLTPISQLPLRPRLLLRLYEHDKLIKICDYDYDATTATTQIDTFIFRCLANALSTRIAAVIAFE